MIIKEREVIPLSDPQATPPVIIYIQLKSFSELKSTASEEVHVTTEKETVHWTSLNLALELPSLASWYRQVRS